MKYIILAALALALASCSSSSSGTAASTNPISQISTNAKNYMASAVPGASSFRLSQRAIGDWAQAGRGVKRPGNGSAATSIQGYFNDLLDPDYSAGDFSPTVFGRFGQEMEVLEIIGAQVPFTSGAPTVGTHSITTNIGDGNTSTTFDVVVTAATNPNFDVVLNITTPFVWKAAFKNSGNKINIVSAEIDGDTDRSVSILFWDTATGKLRYDFLAKQATGTLHEVHRYYIESADGQAYLAHLYEDSSVKNYAVASAANGGSSTEYSASFQFQDVNTPGNSFASESYCVSSDGTATADSVCAGAPLPNTGTAASLDAGLFADINGFANAKAMGESILGVGYADIEAATLNYDTGDFTEFLTNVPD